MKVRVHFNSKCDALAYDLPISVVVARQGPSMTLRLRKKSFDENGGGSMVNA